MPAAPPPPVNALNGSVNESNPMPIDVVDDPIRRNPSALLRVAPSPSFYAPARLFPALTWSALAPPLPAPAVSAAPVPDALPLANPPTAPPPVPALPVPVDVPLPPDRKSTRLNSSHQKI